MDLVSAIRSLALNIILFVGLELSHHLGGGNYSLSLLLLPIFSVSFFIFWTRPVEFIRGPYLALLLILVQVLGHFELSSNVNISQTRMGLAHLVGICVSYFLASNFDKSLLSLFAVLRSIFEPVFLLIFDAVLVAPSIPTIMTKFNLNIEYFEILQRRGPPSIATGRA